MTEPLEILAVLEEESLYLLLFRQYLGMV